MEEKYVQIMENNVASYVDTIIGKLSKNYQPMFKFKSSKKGKKDTKPD